MEDEIVCSECGAGEPSICDHCEVCSGCCNCLTCGDCDKQVESLCDCCELCESCCECATCAGAWRDNSHRCDSSEICDICERCGDHCECPYCDRCEERTSRDGFCFDCDRCEDCGCACESEDDDDSNKYISANFQFYKAGKLEHKLNPSRRFISLEVEVADGDAETVHPVLRKWGDGCVSDGSLPSSGFELNLNPSSGDLFISHVKEVAAALKKAGASVNRECGMHCHVDARDFTRLDLYKLAQIYYKVESALFTLVAPSRQSCGYAHRCADKFYTVSFKDFTNKLFRSMYSWDADKTGKLKPYDLRAGNGKQHAHSHGRTRIFGERHDKYHGARYNALNLHSYFYRGTVEFRHHHGTTNADKMANWGLVCAAIVDGASKLSMREIRQMPEDGFDALMSLLRPELRVWAKGRRDELIARNGSRERDGEE